MSRRANVARALARQNRASLPPARPSPGCTILDRCDQCGRRVWHPHVTAGRAYCSRCCPECAASAAAWRR